MKVLQVVGKRGVQKKNLLLIYVPFNYFDSIKKRKEKVDRSSCREREKKKKLCWSFIFFNIRIS